MNDRSVKVITRPEPQANGLLHPFPTTELRHIDPFVFLDMGPPEHIGDGSGYVPPHPHRGVQPVGLVFRGRVQHRDSLGNHKIVTSGGMQWLVSGSGAMHEEILSGDDDGMLHAAQLWVNLPASLKMKPAQHHALGADQIPEITIWGSVAGDVRSSHWGADHHGRRSRDEHQRRDPPCLRRRTGGTHGPTEPVAVGARL